MQNYRNQYGLVGKIKVEDISNAAVRITFKTSSGNINDSILKHIRNKYHEYLVAHQDLMIECSEPDGLFLKGSISMEIRGKDVKKMVHFLRHALSFAQYNYQDTLRTKNGLVCDFALFPKGETTEVFVRIISENSIPKAVQENLWDYYQRYVNRIRFKGGNRYVGIDIADDRLILEFNTEDVHNAMRKIKKNLALAVKMS